MQKPIDEIISIYNNSVNNSINKCLEYTDYLSKFEFENFLYEIPQMWKQKKKSCRSATVLPIIKILNGENIPKDLKETLIFLDVKINTFDELLDKESLKNHKKAAFVMSNLFSDLGIIKYSITNNNLYDNYMKYLTDIITIPYIEKRTYKKILKTEQSEVEIKESLKSYKFRSEDISIFIDLPNKNLDLKINKKIKRQIYTYRALELLSKDLLDLDDDISNNETKPLTAFLKKYDEKELINKRIKIIKKRLTNSVEWENENNLIEKYLINLRHDLGGYNIEIF